MERHVSKNYYFPNPLTAVVKYDIDMTTVMGGSNNYSVRVTRGGVDVYTPADKLAATLTRSELEEILRHMNALENYSIARKLDRAKERAKAPY